MKNLLFTFIFCFSFLAVGSSQNGFGGGITYLNDLGLQARASVALETIRIIPKASYYFVDGSTLMSFDLDAAYQLVEIADENPIYLFAGPTLLRRSTNGFSSSNFGLNVGAGAQISHIYGEIRYSLFFCDNCNGEIGFAAGYMF